MNDDYKYETERYEEIDPIIDNYRVRLIKSFYQIVGLVDNMDEYLRRAGEYPADITKDDAVQAQGFLETVGTALQEYEQLFNELDK